MSSPPPPPPQSPPPGPPPPPDGGYGGYDGYGGVPAWGMPGPKPDNYLVWAILSTILCCLPAGIVSIVNAAKVDSLYAGGQYAQAVEASRNAQKWAIIAVICGLTIPVIYIVLWGIGTTTY